MGAWQRLIHAVDELDTTAGASLQPPRESVMSDLAWIFEPYRRARTQGALDGATQPSTKRSSMLSDSVFAITWRKSANPVRSINGTSRLAAVPAGQWWRELGAQSRTAMVADGIRAFVSVRSLFNGGWSYTIGRVSPFVSFDIPAILHALNGAEESWRGTWGGGNLVGGSPRVHGSRLTASPGHANRESCLGNVWPVQTKGQSFSKSELTIGGLP